MSKKFTMSAISLLCLLLLSSVLHASEPRLWNLKDVDIRTLVTEVSEATGKSFVIGPNVNAKISFISNHTLSPDELYQAFQALLKTYGYIAIQDGGVVRIENQSLLKNKPGAGVDRDGRPNSERMIVTTLRVKNYSASDLAKVLKPLLPKYSYIEAYQPSNDLIISDHADNVSQLIELVERLDKPISDSVEIIPMHFAPAHELIDTIAKIHGIKTRSTLNKNTGQIGRLRLAADERSNSLLISGGSAEQRLSVRALASKLDVRQDVLAERTEVIYLRYLPAETVAPIVQSMVENYYESKAQQEKKNAKGGFFSLQANAGESAAREDFNLRFPLNNINEVAEPVRGGFRNQEAFLHEIPRSGSLGLYVQWEESTNSLIVTAPTELLYRIKRVISKIDIRRPQVLIEAVIAEVSIQRMSELGVEWNLDGTVSFDTRFPPSGPLSSIATGGGIGTTGIAGAVGSGLSFGVFQGGSLRLLVRALRSEADANILATPNLVTLDNEIAQIKVGKKVSFAIGQIENNPTGGNPFTSFEREDVGLILTIKPQITPDGSIRLVIQQELSNVVPGTENIRAGSNPDTTERFISTTVMADNGKILILGGLLQNEWQNIELKVPVLGDVPGLGKLFRSDKRTMNKSNLMIFLRPLILYDSRQGDEVTEGKYEFLRQDQLMLDNQPRKYITNPALPDYNGELNLPAPF